MNARLQPITTKAMTRPSYGHRELLGFDRGTWVLVNLPALEDRYRACGTGDQFSEDEFRRFCWVQYDLECAEKEDFKDQFRSHRIRGEEP